MKNEALHVLLVNDNPDDRALVMREVAREFPQSQFHHATAPGDLVQIMDGGMPHVVVTEYELRWTDGITVLRSVKARRPDCVVIMFTASGSEEIAVRALKAGLDDYVRKSTGDSGRLSAALHLALSRLEQHRAAELVERRYRRFFEKHPLGLCRLARNGQILDANTALQAVLRCPERDLLLATNLLSLISETGKRRALQQALEKTGVVQHFTAQLTPCTGEIILVEANMRAVSEEPGAGYEGSLQEVPSRARVGRLAGDYRDQLRALAQTILRETEAPTPVAPVPASALPARPPPGSPLPARFADHPLVFRKH